MATSYSTLLGLALPVQGELSGTWGDTVNNYITNYLDAAVAGTQTLSTDADVTLTKTTGSALTSTSSQYAIINCTGARTAQRTITAPAASKIYTVINATTGGFAVKLVGAGPTTGVIIDNGVRAVVAWNGSDFVILSQSNSTGGSAYSGTGARITGDFTNATIANRVMFQTSTANGPSNLGVIPNGTSAISIASVWNSATPDNSQYGEMRINGSTDFRISTSYVGTPASGTYLPMTFYTGGSETLRLTTDKRIQGDFSNATVASRVMFQTSTTNGNTLIGLIPNGTGQNARIQAFSASDPANASTISLEANAAVGQSLINADKNGTGTYLPMTFYTGGSERMRIYADGVNTETKAASTGNSIFKSSGGTAGYGAFYAYNAGTAANYNYIFFGDAGGEKARIGQLPDTSLAIYRGSAATLSATFDASGNFTAVGNVTAYSDERLKTNWRDFAPEFLERLAAVKAGTYDRLDESTTQDGVSAQSLQAVLPNSVFTSKDGTLSVAYGNAALAAAVMLARKVVELEARLAKLEA